MKFFTRNVVLTILTLFLLTWIVNGINATSGLTVILAGVAIAIFNSTLRPLLKMLFLPINLITLGIFNWMIDLFVLYIALWLVPGFQVGPVHILGVEFGQFWSLVIFSFGLSLGSSFIGGLL